MLLVARRGWGKLSRGRRHEVGIERKKRTTGRWKKKKTVIIRGIRKEKKALN